MTLVERLLEGRASVLEWVLLVIVLAVAVFLGWRTGGGDNNG